MVTQHENNATRVVLLGASNVTRGISIAIQTARNMFHHPIDIYVAAGHGRSYGLQTAVLTRRLVGIRECELWQVLKKEPNRPTFALITDIGNDLLYGVSTCQITSWINESVDRLCQIGVKTNLTSLPVENLLSLGKLRYLILRTLLFPACRIELEKMVELAFELNEKVLQVTNDHLLTVIQPKLKWYGIDPIHIQKKFFCEAWEHLLISWKKNENNIKKIKGSFRRWFYLQSRVPAQRSLLGVSHGSVQPTARFSDGTTVSFF